LSDFGPALTSTPGGVQIVTGAALCMSGQLISPSQFVMTRFRVLISSDPSKPPRTLPSAGRFQRVKTLIAALFVASVLIGFLFAALMLGSIIAAFLVILAAVGSVLMIFKAAIGRAR
jgi:hypothetical protein